MAGAPKFISHPKSVRGDFYVVKDECLACGVPHVVAPDLIGWTGETIPHCYWKKQPENQAEIERAIAVLEAQELECHRYAGSDPAILDRVTPAYCDYPKKRSRSVERFDLRPPRFALLDDGLSAIKRAWRRITRHHHPAVDPAPLPLLPSYVCLATCGPVLEAADSLFPHALQGLGTLRRFIMSAIKFRGVDFLQYDSLLTDDERLVRDTTRQFIEDNLIPIIEECNRAGRFPRELVKPMADLGFFGASLKGYGCAGMGNVEYGLMTQELERGDSGVRSFVSVQSGLCMYPIYEFGSEEQKQTWLPPMQKGEKLGCFGLTEPDFGSNPGRMGPRAKKVGNEYVINGEKMWITSGTIADVAIIWAKVEDEKDRIRGFLVETDRPGFKADDIHGKWSLRASGTSGLSLQDVRVPGSNLLPGSNGLKSPLMCLNQARYGIAWGAVGAAMACYDCALQYSQLRKQWRDQPIASHQLIQEKLAWMISEITKAQLLILQVGRLKDAGKVEHQHISMAKRNNVWMALECARLSRDILGANGVADDYPIMRHLMNLESVKTYEGTHDIHTLIIGASVTGLEAF